MQHEPNRVRQVQLSNVRGMYCLISELACPSFYMEVLPFRSLSAAVPIQQYRVAKYQRQSLQYAQHKSISDHEYNMTIATTKSTWWYSLIDHACASC